MRITQAILATLFLVAVTLTPASQAGDGQAVVDDAEAACAPPCGYINPYINVQIEDKPACGTGARLGGEIDPEDCYPLPADGESLEVDGTLQWYWEVSEEGTYPNDPQQDIVISFSGSSSNPDWLSASVEPGEFVLTTVDLFDPANMKTEETDTGTRVWFWFEEPITITVTRDGDPSAEEVADMEARQGIEVFFLKAKSTASGDRFKAAFGIEEFRFHALGDDGIVAQSADDRDTPGLGPVLGLGALAVVAVLRRRR